MDHGNIPQNDIDIDLESKKTKQNESVDLEDSQNDNRLCLFHWILLWNIHYYMILMSIRGKLSNKLVTTYYCLAVIKVICILFGLMDKIKLLKLMLLVQNVKIFEQYFLEVQYDINSGD